MKSSEHYFGLMIGIGNYRNIRPLYKTTKDASDFYTTLTQAGYLPSNLSLLLDQNATRNAISAQLNRLAKVAKSEEDTVIIYFSGHGARFEGGFWAGEYLCPVETDLNHQDPRLTLISSADFSTAIQRIRAGRVVVLLDACHAGGIGEVKDAELDVKVGLTENVLSKLASGKGRVIIASSKTDEPSYELADMENGLFTHYLLDGLRGNAALPDGSIPITRLFGHVYYHVVDHKPQHPFMKFDGEDFAIAQQPSSAVSTQDQSQQKDAILINVRAEQFTPEQAEQILSFLYQTYHKRGLDDVARIDWLPFLQKYGFIGLGMVFEMIANSREMRNRVKPELKRIYMEQFGRNPIEHEIENYGKLIRFLSDSGKTELITRINVANQLRDQAGVLFRQENPAEAEKILLEAIAKGIPGAGVWHDYGISLYRQGKYEEAIPVYHRAIELNPNDDGLFFWSCDDLKRSYDRLARIDATYHQKGYEYFEPLTQIYPKRWRVWYETGWMAWKLGRFEESIPFFHKSIQLLQDNNWPWCHDDLKYCYHALAEKDPELYNTGINYFLEDTRIHPERWAAWHQCGWLSWKAGKLSEAIPYYQKAISLVPENTWAWSALDLLQVYRETNQKEQAYDYYVGLLPEKSGQWEIWQAKAWIEWQFRNNVEEAVQAYRKAIELNSPGWVWSWVDLGDCLKEIGNLNGAREAYEKAAAVEPKHNAPKERLANAK